MAYKQAETQSRQAKAHQDRRRCQPEIVATHDRKNERSDADCHQQRRKSVRSRRLVARHVGQHAPADQNGREADGNVDEEDPAPAHRHEQAADEWTERGCEAAGRRPHPYGPAAPLRRKRREKHADRCRSHQRGTGRLNDTEHIKREHARGQGAGGRRGREQTDAQQERQVAPVALGQSPEEDEQRRIGDGIAVEHP